MSDLDGCRLNFFCGGCEAVFEIMTTEYEDSAWLMAHRWVNAHVKCGFMLPTANVSDAVKLELGWQDLPPGDDEAVDLDEDAGIEAPGD